MKKKKAAKKTAAKKAPKKRVPRAPKKASTEGLVTRAEAARQLDVAPARINKWAQDGAPVAVAGARGHSAMYRVEELRAWLQARAERPGDAIALGQEKAKLTRAQTHKVEMENALRERRLIDRGAAVSEGQKVLASVRARLIHAARQCVLRGLPRSHEALVKAVIMEALLELSGWTTVQDAERALAELGEAS